MSAECGFDTAVTGTRLAAPYEDAQPAQSGDGDRPDVCDEDCYEEDRTRPASARGGGDSEPDEPDRDPPPSADEDLSDVGRVFICMPDVLRAACTLADPTPIRHLVGDDAVLLLRAGQLMMLDGESFEEEGFRDRLRVALRTARRDFDATGDFTITDLIDGLVEPGVLERLDVADLRPSECWDTVKQFLFDNAVASVRRSRGHGNADAGCLLADVRDRLDQILELGQANVAEARVPDPEDEFRPFPVHLLPPPIEAFVRETAGSKICDPAMVVLPVLTTIGASIGLARQIEVKDDWREYPIVWSAQIAESGTRKTPVFEAVAAPLKENQRLAHEDFESRNRIYTRQLRDWERRARGRGANSEAGQDDTAGRPPCEPRYDHIMTSDSTVEGVTKMLATSRKGLIILKDELSDFVGNLDAYKRRSNDSAKYLEWFGGNASKTDRKNSPSIFVERAGVWITGSIQPAVFCRNFTAAYTESGFLGRFLLVFPPRRVQGWSDAVISPATAAAWAGVIDWLRALEFCRVRQEGDEFTERLVPVVVGMTVEARQRMKEFVQRHAEETHALADTGLQAAWGKMVGYAAKFALIDHLVRQVGYVGQDGDRPEPDGGQERISSDSVDRAIAMAEWFKHEARRIYRMRVEMSSTSDQDRRELLDFIARKGGQVTPRQVATNFRRFNKNSKQAKEELDELFSEGLGTWQKKPASPRGGRPTEFFVLRPVSAS